VKYTENGDTIELRSRASGGDVVIEVADAGDGVPEDALAQIFERFARADTARSRVDGGVGLGLAIADAIAKAHGGKVSVRTSAHGSTFSLALPGYTAPAAETIRAAPIDTGPVLGAQSV
jgi:signal transduction histidine kinase